MNNQKILWITRTAIFIALLVVVQAATMPLGITLITGSAVNMILSVSVMTCGLPSGLAVALVSPFMAKLFGIGPLWELIPFIAVGNITLVLVWRLIGEIKFGNRYISYIAALLAGAVTKFLILYVSIVRIMVPFFLNLKEQQVSTISKMFSVSQLFTALIGGTLAILAIPVVKKAVKTHGN